MQRWIKSVKRWSMYVHSFFRFFSSGWSLISMTIQALVAREEEAKKQKVEQVKRWQQQVQADEEAIKDAGRRMLEEAQKRAAAIAAAATAARAARAPEAAARKPTGGV